MAPIREPEPRAGRPGRARWWRPVAAVLEQVHVPAPGVRLMDGRVSLGVF